MILSIELIQNFLVKTQVLIEAHDDGWIDLTINQDELKLLDLLNYVINELSLKDVKIEEIRTENVIRKIYEGALR